MAPGKRPRADIDQRARRIRDPIKRLRFLRRVMRPRPAPVPEAAARQYQFYVGDCDTDDRPAPVPEAAARQIPLSLLMGGLFLVFAGMVSVAGRVPAPLPARVPAPLPAPTARPVAAPPQEAPRLWLVEKTAGGELYSNGLRVETQRATSTRPRLYRALPRSSAQDRDRRWRTLPAGIVFHASESELASFEPERNGLLKRQVLGLLEYAQRHGLYHYVVDRFGRVHRIVEESDVADHAGHSLWADTGWIYLNLNASFLGVAFEAQTEAAAAHSALSPAQAHAGKILLEILRGKYAIAPENCVTHAQVSVNPQNFRIGFHADWARHFPFRPLGLPDNYRRPPPSVALFGFGYEPAFFDSADLELQASLLGADEQVRQEAAGRSMPPARWRQILHRRYREASFQTIRERAALTEAPAPQE
jgi:hypothetical protein